MLKLLPYILFEKYVYLHFSIGNGQPVEPTLCQSYRHTFVPYEVRPNDDRIFGGAPVARDDNGATNA